VVSAVIPRQTFYSLNMDTIDPADAMRNFVHNMKFSKTAGLSPVEMVDPMKYPPNS
jgi:hypothetical protein